MKKLFLATVIAVPLIELTLIVLFVNWIGVWPTLLLMLLTSVVGVLFAKRQGVQTLRLAQLQMQKSQVPSQVLLDGVCIFVGGALLVLPGFLTDMIGLIILLPWTRTIVKAALLKVAHAMIAKGNFVVIRRR
ncbi:FxsA family protein [Bacillus sp. JCM 19041]|uniref:FxsA family protein n=1 Tax=Bacillus sp. JCM 19041 TaxID=1460637 RepID=UPI0006D28798